MDTDKHGFDLTQRRRGARTQSSNKSETTDEACPIRLAGTLAPPAAALRVFPGHRNQGETHPHPDDGRRSTQKSAERMAAKRRKRNKTTWFHRCSAGVTIHPLGEGIICRPDIFRSSVSQQPRDGRLPVQRLGQRRARWQRVKRQQQWGCFTIFRRRR